MRSTPYAIVRRGLYGLWNMDRMPVWHLSHGIIRHAPDEMRAGLVDIYGKYRKNIYSHVRQARICCRALSALHGSGATKYAANRLEFWR
jgi:hypothetical protein